MAYSTQKMQYLIQNMLNYEAIQKLCKPTIYQSVYREKDAVSLRRSFVKDIALFSHVFANGFLP